MPERKTLERARRDKREGKAPTTQAGEFVREEIEHIREGKHGARSTKQAIAIGLSKARRAGVKLKPPKKGQASARTREGCRPCLPRRSERNTQKTVAEAIARNIAGTQTGAPQGGLSQGALETGTVGSYTTSSVANWRSAEDNHYEDPARRRRVTSFARSGGRSRQTTLAVQQHDSGILCHSNVSPAGHGVRSGRRHAGGHEAATDIQRRRTHRSRRRCREGSRRLHGNGRALWGSPVHHRR